MDEKSNEHIPTLGVVTIVRGHQMVRYVTDDEASTYDYQPGDRGPNGGSSQTIRRRLRRKRQKYEM